MGFASRHVSRRLALLFVGLALLLGSADLACAASGYVAHRKDGCDYFVVQTVNGSAVLEWYGGDDPDIGDRIVGDFEQYGMKDVWNATKKQELTVWVEDYFLGEDDAMEKLYEECE